MMIMWHWSLYVEPTVYTNSYFGDGDLPIVYSNMECRGYENTVLECTKQEFGTFTCSRDKVVGITCQDGMWCCYIRSYEDFALNRLWKW